ncbi:DUF3592 domain-containing protein [Mucilaginibacter ginsenosidivorax]|uniref:DUF3592 domain-containing protein n=1 Tax=Mucilaginibacter ginsenosidivorax TaxID=862126 RepID=A0A5B8W6Y4_9SPHI|nr:DUF3592 domain-containing protein [Mucilaginibacter ginsenosidivorax]QEC79634.1 DUF3592 domain-containing protein [Mucilaginibacter ginsenosidivorax]
MNATIDELILLAGGTFLIVWGIGKINERRKLLKSGLKVDGVVFKLEERLSSGTDRMLLYYPVIRYVTLDKNWITEEYAVGSNPSAYKEGDVVKIIYDPADYKHFIIDNFLSKVLGWVLALIGVVILAGVLITIY